MWKSAPLTFRRIAQTQVTKAACIALFNKKTQTAVSMLHNSKGMSPLPHYPDIGLPLQMRNTVSWALSSCSGASNRRPCFTWN